MQAEPCPVNSHNEWDPLEEVIVGRLDKATVPTNHITFMGMLPKAAARLYWWLAGHPYPTMFRKRAQKELDEFVHVLEAEGITVRRPDVMDFTRTFKTPYWKSKGFTSACPRDLTLIVGDQIIEGASGWRARYFEPHVYRTLFQEYYNKGARWSSAPKPQLKDSFYDYTYTQPKKGEPIRYMINEDEPVWDAADFVRCGRDLFVTRSNVTNLSGINWVRRHLGDEYRVHEIESLCTVPMHIDTTFMPLAPGKVMVNPEFIDVKRLPPILKSWDILVAPDKDPIPRSIPTFYLSLVSGWMGLNVLMLDEKRVIVEKSQVSMHKALKDWGFEPIPLPFLNGKMFGGGFHCFTLDIRRTGGLQSYF
ncbi:MAG: amidinotransferase [Proteobacteria bacterium]|nr:amidinotransferase [Pseudomonadota bacterium]MBU1686729.1 amidinotransferase [Pseudomonadota bacterium]